MRIVRYTGRFPRDYKREKSGWHGKQLDAELLETVTMLAEDKALPRRYFDHPLGGEWSDHRDCHIRPDLILIYRPVSDNSTAATVLIRQRKCHSGAARRVEPGIHTHRPLEYGFRVRRCAAPRNDSRVGGAGRPNKPPTAGDTPRPRHHIAAMTVFLTILLVLALLAVLGVLGMGLATMIRGDNPRLSNRLMQSRVALQGVALVVLVLLMLLAGNR